MKEDRASMTAMCTAIYRAAELQRPEHERLCNDIFAKAFLPPLFLSLLNNRWLTRWLLWFFFERKVPGAVNAVLARARYIDDQLAACINDGYRQVIILGAGYDSRAHRFNLPQKQIRFLELDHPMTQRQKKTGVIKIFGKLPPNVAYIPVDFENESLREKLLGNKEYDKTEKTLFIWEGVTKYLSKEAVEAVLSFVTTHSTPGSSIIFDYVFNSVVTSGAEKTIFRNLSKYQDKDHEPFRFGLDESNLVKYITEQGFSTVENIALHELKALFMACIHQRSWPEVSFGGIVFATV